MSANALFEKKLLKLHQWRTIKVVPVNERVEGGTKLQTTENVLP